MADAVAASRKRLIGRAKLAVALLLLPIIGRAAWLEHGDYLDRRELLRRQQKILNFATAPTLIAYAEDRALGSRLLASDPNYVSIGYAACYLPKIFSQLSFGNGPP